MEVMENFKLDGFEAIDLSNIKVGDNVVSKRGMFGTLEKITPKGKYAIRYDADYYGEPTTKFTPELFKDFFLVDRRPKS